MGTMNKSLASTIKCLMAHTACPFTVKLGDPRKMVRENDISKIQTNTFQTKEV
jgi:hypothetical protein